MSNEYDPEFEDYMLRQEFGSTSNKRNKFRCSDRLCGSEDCSNCHPEGCEEPEEEKDEAE